MSDQMQFHDRFTSDDPAEEVKKLVFTTIQPVLSQRDRRFLLTPTVRIEYNAFPFILCIGHVEKGKHVYRRKAWDELVKRINEGDLGGAWTEGEFYLNVPCGFRMIKGAVHNDGSVWVRCETDSPRLIEYLVMRREKGMEIAVELTAFADGITETNYVGELTLQRINLIYREKFHPTPEVVLLSEDQLIETRRVYECGGYTFKVSITMPETFGAVTIQLYAVNMNIGSYVETASPADVDLQIETAILGLMESLPDTPPQPNSWDTPVQATERNLPDQRFGKV